MEDAGSLPIEMDVTGMHMGDVVDIYPHAGKATKHGDESAVLAEFELKTNVIQDESFCHTAAYPKPVDVVTHATLPDFIRNRGGVSLKPGDGIIHSWLNRMLLPDTVGTGGDSHTRFPVGISFPAGSGLVAFAAATGVMPLDMPESVKRGLLTVEKQGKKNIFSGRVLEIEGVSHLKCEQAFELSDAFAERSAAGCTIQLGKEPIVEYLESNKWLEDPQLMEADPDAEYAEVIEIDLADIKEPARVADAATVVSTSTRNFPNRLGKGANVYLASAELAACAAILGKLPTPEEYFDTVKALDTTAADTYRYLNFDELPDFVEAADFDLQSEARSPDKRRLGPANQKPHPAPDVVDTPPPPAN
ncbi:3-isopropylmalate dehydratase [Aureococcus anophagefferens]|nr:3-isopropylmalate dehydratase [Aureococcus anophagefferens]